MYYCQKTERMKKYLYRQFGIILELKMSTGFALGPINIRTTKKPKNGRSWYAMNYLKDACSGWGTILDVGAGDLEHSLEFAGMANRVEAIDLGISYYANKRRETLPENIVVHDINIFDYKTDSSFDLFWLSHILEHTHNPGAMLSHLFKYANNKSYCMVTLPHMHAKLWPGHLSLWSPGSFIYFVASLGYDMSDAQVIYGANEFSIYFPVRKWSQDIVLHYDVGDIEKLKVCLPGWVKENGKSWL